MTPEALIMMILALVIVWGGLVASLVHLKAHPDEGGTDDII
ncbi:methionine/alanine import family NSS transporter small subunit [Brevibacterium sp. p3-SID960]|nr:methionine/alanine import family NSS transporter small subunit [Brevibacterium sp. p3-SID960]MCT1689808.1 methionine/alanine import family NSS transporter small subunit [Brevibacterium sp. p3-SID960]